jgi:hypothetical protein
MPPHGGFRRFGIVTLDSGKNSAVASQRFLGPPFNLQGAFTRVA